MWTYHPDLLERPVPRYTSFPTAAEFGNDIGPRDLEEQLDTLAPGEAVSLYLHIPYCHEICWYCGCNTGAANRRTRLAGYLAALDREIELLAARIGKRVRISRIAWGGGSPNALDPVDFLAIGQRLDTLFDTSAAATSVEIDPRAFTPEWSDALAIARVSRASLGVQTFSSALQERIGRVQPEAMIVRSVELLRAAGVASINFDLMYGLPGQGTAELDATFDATLALAPERIAVFGYAHVPHLVPRQRRIDATALPGPEARFRQAELAHRRLVAAGYQPIGFDHFARPEDAIAIAAREGRLRRNFQGFTEDGATSLIGLGASAISAFPGALLQNEKNAGRYQMSVNAGAFAVSRGIRRGAPDQRRGRCIEQLLCDGRADLAGLPGLDGIRASLSDFVERRLLAWDGDALRLSADALPYARSIAAMLDPYRADAAHRFSSAV